MVVPATPKKRKANDAQASKACLFLGLACLWPLFLMALIASSAPHVDQNSFKQLAGQELQSVRNVLDRVDLFGYGPTKPRVAVVIVGQSKDDLVLSLESVFLNTDMNRIFVVVVVVDGHGEDPALEKELKKIDTGVIPHWHGLRPDLHGLGQTQDDDPHGNKVKVLFNPIKQGLSQSRADAVTFVEILNKNHEATGLKSTSEDLILLLLRSGAQLTSRKWLGAVTDALIVPPPLLEEGDAGVAIKIANAVSFNLEGPGKRTSFDTTFTPVLSKPTAEDINLSSGASYPTPVLNGAATAMRLGTYVYLPSRDTSLRDEWATNLELSLNLWMCADGIDMIKDLEVTSFHQDRPAPLGPDMAARFAAAWMDIVSQKKFFNAYTKVYSELTWLEWQTLMANAQASPTFTSHLSKKCRGFKWYAEHVNPEIASILSESDQIAQDGDSNKQFTESQREIKSKEVPTSVDDTEPENPQDAENEKKLNVESVDSGDDGTVSIPDRPDDRKKPSKPLCKECLEIVQRAQPIDISFKDASGGYKEHPHMGATNENGTLGYVHDAKALRKNPPKYAFDNIQEACLKRDNTYKMLHQKVFVDLEYDRQMEKAEHGKRPKLFCLVYTTEQSHSLIANIRETWGPKCDGFMVGSNKTDAYIGAVNIVHEGPEEYGNIWQKVRSMWSYIYDHYYEEYDWFHIGGDDLFLIVENLRYYVESEEIRTAANGGVFLPDGSESVHTPLFLGRRFAYQGDKQEIFNSGGSGYTINKAALKTLVLKAFPEYFPHAHTFSEDTMVARVLRNYGIYPYETKDEFGGERYMPFMPGHHYGYRLPSDPSQDWYALYSINIKEGLDHCAARSIAFHYVKDNGMKRLFALLYHLCPADTVEANQ